MNAFPKLYQTALNPLLIEPHRPLPGEIAVNGAGTIGPDIGYYLKSAMPDVSHPVMDNSPLSLPLEEFHSNIN